MSTLTRRSVIGTIETFAVLSSAAAILWTLVIQPQMVSAKRATRNAAPHSPIETIKTDLRTTTADATIKIGSPRLAIVEFSDFQCPYCARYATETFAKINHEFVQTGLVAYVFRNFPIESIHALSLNAAEAAECSGRQGHYLEMHDLMFRRPQALSPDDLANDVRALHLDEQAFRACIASSAGDAIRRDQLEGFRLGVRSTPTFLIGTLQADGATIIAQKRITGAQSLETFKTAIQSVSPPPAISANRHS
jgi:protein-disulfide isomerase